MNVVYIVQRIGPYHQARFNQLAKDLSSKGSQLNIVEICQIDGEYEWDIVKGEMHFSRSVLFEKEYGAIGFIDLLKGLFGCLKILNPDVVCIPGWSAKEAKISLLWCKLHKVKSILLSDSSELDFVRNSIKEFVKGQIIKLYNVAFVAGTPQKDYVLKLGMDSEKIMKGYDVVDNRYFFNNRNKTYQPNGYILAIGRFLRRKNFSMLIEAYDVYRKKVENPKKLLLCGSGEELTNIIYLISELQIEEFVELPGFIQYNELPKYYSNASVFIIPSISEQWGLVINEAMASGLPILSSDRCGAKFDLVQEGVNGFIFNPFDVQSISNTLIKFDILSDLKKQQFSKASLKIIAKWSPKTFSESLQRLMELAFLRDE